MGRKCRTNKKSRKILRELRDILLTQLFVFYLSLTVNVYIFLEFFFSVGHFQRGVLKTNEWEIRNKYGSCSKFFVTDINEFLSSFYNYELVNQNNVRELSKHISD